MAKHGDSTSVRSREPQPETPTQWVIDPAFDKHSFGDSRDYCNFHSAAYQRGFSLIISITNPDWYPTDVMDKQFAAVAVNTRLFKLSLINLTSRLICFILYKWNYPIYLSIYLFFCLPVFLLIHLYEHIHCI